MEGGRDGGREGGREEGRERGREGKVHDKENDSIIYSSLTPHTSLLIPHSSHSSSLTPHTSLLTLLTPHSSYLTPHTPHPSLLTLHTPHSSPSPLPHLTSLPTFSTVRKCLERGRREEWGTYLPPPSSWSLRVVHQTGSHEADLSSLAACVQVEEAEMVRERRV